LTSIGAFYILLQMEFMIIPKLMDLFQSHDLQIKMPTYQSCDLKYLIMEAAFTHLRLPEKTAMVVIKAPSFFD
jgi:hypothetical protein